MYVVEDICLHMSIMNNSIRYDSTRLFFRVSYFMDMSNKISIKNIIRWFILARKKIVLIEEQTKEDPYLCEVEVVHVINLPPVCLVVENDERRIEEDVR